MSAFLCTAEHLSALVNYASAHARAGCYFKLLPSDDAKRKTDADYTFEVLLRANLESLAARYGDRSGAMEEWTSEPLAYVFKFNLHKVWHPVQIIKLCHCYAYQACEFEEWEESQAKKWIDSVERHAIRHLPGYEEAPWGL